jgi:AraC-like DNA-binding protein
MMDQKRRLLFWLLIGIITLRLSMKFIVWWVIHDAPFQGYLVFMSNLGISTHFAIGPLFYLYVRRRLNPDFEIKSSAFLHFIPFGILYVTLFLYDQSFWRLGVLRIHYIHIITYYLLALRSFIQHYSRLDDHKPLYLLKLTFIGMSVLMIAYTPILYLYVNITDALLIVGGSIFVAYMFIINKGNFYAHTKYKSSSLSEEKSKKIKGTIMELMDRDQIFLDSTLTLNRLSQMIGINPKHISQCINTEFDLSFSDFVNTKRIEIAKEKLVNPANQDYKIAYIAYSSGFESLSSFNSAFKKYTGMTPSTFRKENLKLC